MQSGDACDHGKEGAELHGMTLRRRRAVNYIFSVNRPFGSASGHAAWQVGAAPWDEPAVNLAAPGAIGGEEG
jgi:hypothetical protein